MTPNREKEAALTHDLVKELLRYDQESGQFFWRKDVARNVKAGREAGGVHQNGYRLIFINGRRYLAHRLAWFYVNGKWPADQLDHINRDRMDNRIANLRECDPSENGQNRSLARNNTSGHLGVSRMANGWSACIHLRGTRHYLGYFPTKQQAMEARSRAKANLHTFNPTEASA